jgi:hypothetical protein
MLDKTISEKSFIPILYYDFIKENLPTFVTEIRSNLVFDIWEN